ncbi:TetR/AcrR family transcriptional regulator [Parenemella sanctibonifatiensis]|uniref:Transcriptional regulator n=1 Tax=Parenemella sanctibonifatiensis TaxID=2016505 RepID=A0A255ED56_9ACTN|nr:TetR/AcrR family transcriptional regulator [Parenemella sanctibonifatiensis]OYN88851.1 transcriptional regulator [Parenemella sanctibonifatiensis]
MPKQVDEDQRRTEIAYGVIAVMAERGLAAVSLRSVAAAAGISMGRVQHYFATKAELVQHACAMILERAHARFDEAGGSPREQLRDLLTMGLPSSEQDRTGAAVWYAFIGAAATDPALAAIIREGWDGMQESARRLLVEAGVPDPTVAARALTAISDGLVLRILLGHLDAPSARQAIDAALADWLPQD